MKSLERSAQPLQEYLNGNGEKPSSVELRVFQKLVIQHSRVCPDGDARAAVDFVEPVAGEANPNERSSTRNVQAPHCTSQWQNLLHDVIEKMNGS